MSSNYECSVELRPLEKKIKDFAHSHGYDIIKVFGNLLDYIIGNFDVEHNPVKGWDYPKEQNADFHDMMITYFHILEKVIDRQGWCDAWGDLFMSLHPSGGGKGQFFTPDDICNLMTRIELKEEPEAKQFTIFGMRAIVNDCAAGSSRNLLAAYAHFIEKGWRKPYLSAEDVDYTCCKMSAINMAVHGCYGEVVCHNTLTEPAEVRVGYLVNGGLYRGFPTIRMVNDPTLFIATRRTCMLQEKEKQKKEHKQLELW